MATNPPKGDGHRNGAVKERSQTYNPKTQTWTKRDANTGKFMDGKKDGTPFKGRLCEVMPHGELIIESDAYGRESFLFKEIEFVIGGQKS